jgi:uncharacterized protein (TIGR00255 family)
MAEAGSDTLKSMTGHGVGEAPLGPARVQVEIRSLNYRYFEVRVRLAPALALHTGAVEELVRKALVRGRIDVTGRMIGEVLDTPVLDVGRARAAYEQLLALRDALSPGEPVPLSLLASVPDLFTSRGAADPGAARDAILRATEQACRGVWDMRAREGAALAADLEARTARLFEDVSAIERRAPAIVVAARKRLSERIEKLLGAAAAPIDPIRLEQEVAILADRMDVTEECTRLRSHVDQFRALLAAPDTEALGRRLDFLLQEMAREANTIGAKSADADTVRAAVDLRAEIERMREQVQNVM